MQVMTTSPLVKKYTLEEFWALPEPKDGSKLELIAGVLYMTPPPDSLHNFSSAALNRIFILHLEKIHDRGIVFTPRTALWTGADTYVEPDLFYLSARTLKHIDWKRLDRADLVVEIISPGSAIYDRNTKADTYAALGVRELWLVDPENQTVEVRNLRRLKRAGREERGVYSTGKMYRRGDRVESKVPPAFSPSVSEICRAVPRKSK
jgi:Uma2 family endonuclease